MSSKPGGVVGTLQKLVDGREEIKKKADETGEQSLELVRQMVQKRKRMVGVRGGGGGGGGGGSKKKSKRSSARGALKPSAAENVAAPGDSGVAVKGTGGVAVGDAVNEIERRGDGEDGGCVDMADIMADRLEVRACSLACCLRTVFVYTACTFFMGVPSSKSHRGVVLRRARYISR